MDIKHTRKKGRQRMDDSGSVKTGLIDMTTKEELLVTKAIPAVCRQIKYYREKRGIEQKALAHQLGINPNAVSNWENGRSRPDLSLLQSICESLNISLYTLLDIENPLDTYTAGEQLLLDDYRSLSDAHQYVVRTLINSLKTIETAQEQREVVKLTHFERPLAAGIGDPSEFLDQGNPIYLYATPASNVADCIFTVNGDSMEPQFKNGDMVYVQRFPNCGELKPGEIGAFIIGNEMYIKVFESDGLHSLNESYQPMKFSSEDCVYLIGRVLGIVDYNDFAKKDDVRRYQKMYESVD